MKKIVDCFTFYNELDLLTYRLNILDKLVDYFIIVESTHTFSGNEKKLYFNENKMLFDKFKDKIVHIVVDDFPYKYPNIDYELYQQWKNENYQRDCISIGIDRLQLDEEDIILINDLDEIPDPNTIYNIKYKKIPSDIYSLEMDFYYYNLNSRYDSKWTSGKLITYKKYIEITLSCDKIRHFKDCLTIKKGGWHLSYFGDELFIKNKIEMAAHQELNKSEFTDVKKIEKRIKNFEDLFDRKYNIYKMQKISIAENDYLPPEYDKYLSNFIVL
jgi:beta-1,4-mannosyl-glycoprotein beta-1,4-N-acetylglucosaminyltransferase